jgi:hypothetical protein
MPNRVTFLVDGFNLYFSVRHAETALRASHLRWLDVSGLLHLQTCDTLVIVSGDTDFAPAMRTAKRLFPGVQVCVAFPHARFNAELQQIADFSFRIRAARYAEHQLPDPARLSDGRVIRRPRDW